MAEIPPTGEAIRSPLAEAASVPRRGGTAPVLLSLIFGAAAGALAFVLILRYGQSFELPSEVFPFSQRIGLKPEEQTALDAARRVQHFQNTALTYALFGGAVGLALGLAAGLSRRSVVRTAVGLVAGVGLGAIFGGLAGLAARFLDERFGIEGSQQIHAALWNGVGLLIVGLGAGLGAGFVAGRTGRTMFATAAAGLVAGLLFPLIAAVALPLVPTDGTLPYGRSALALWTIVPASLMGLVAGRVWTAAPKRQAASTVTAPAS